MLWFICLFIECFHEMIVRNLRWGTRVTSRVCSVLRPMLGLLSSRPGLAHGTAGLSRHQTSTLDIEWKPGRGRLCEQTAHRATGLTHKPEWVGALGVGGGNWPLVRSVLFAPSSVSASCCLRKHRGHLTSGFSHLRKSSCHFCSR